MHLIRLWRARARSWVARPCAWVLVGCLALPACGGGADEAPAAEAPPAAQQPVQPVVLPPPVLSFTDTGLNVGDGVTSNGLWSVTTDELAWEYSVDQGATWIRGTGNSFLVSGDGPKMIWVRTRDDLGNTSEIVIVTCVLDTMAPGSVAANPSSQGATRTLHLARLEPGARWEYSFDDQATWLPGTGTSLGVLGNDLGTVWIRQVDVAGNASPAQAFTLERPGMDDWHEASANPLQPSVLGTGALTVLIHGSVVRGDADFVRWDVPAGHRVQSVRLVNYQSTDLVAFYAIQPAAVFDAGVDTQRMLVYGHMGPTDLMKNVVEGVAAERLGPGPMTLWFQQTGPAPTRYAIELVLRPD